MAESMALAAEIFDELQKVGDMLQSRPCLRVSKTTPRCFDVEDARLKRLVGKTRRLGGTPAVLERDPERMCSECGAYEHVLRAIEKMRDEADEERRST